MPAIAHASTCGRRLGRRPFARGCDADRDEQADAHTEDGLCGRQHGERWRRGAESGAEGDERRPETEELTQAGSSSRRGEDQRGHSARRAGDGSQLSCGGGRDAELTRDIDEDRGQDEQSRLRREEAREQYEAGVAE